jgi:predicted nuclease of restriction endonuclease-like (RecB) superfamily
MISKDIDNYGFILHQLKEKIKAARAKAIWSVNKALLSVYWEIGNAILEQEEQQGWGARIVEKLALNLKFEFPDMKGLSPRNLRFMRDFSVAYPLFLILQQTAAKNELPESQVDIILQQAAAKLPWGHHQVILIKLKTLEERCFYIQKTFENGWSRSILEHQIEGGLYKSQGSLSNNFKHTLPSNQSGLTLQVFKDPYNFDFIMLGEKAKERDLESALMTHLTKVLLELGSGFAFMGRQKRFEIAGKEFFIDLLFYHTKLRRHIIIELKVGEFEAEYISKMNLYLGLADDQLKGELDEPAIGIILCKTNNKVIAEYALRDSQKPIGIAEYKIAEFLPDDIKGELPSISEIEQRMDEEIKDNLSSKELRLMALKEKIKSISNQELQTPVDEKIANIILKNYLFPLYNHLLFQLTDAFGHYFLSQTKSWTHNGSIVYNLSDLEVYYENHENIKHLREIEFSCQFKGFKKAGTEDYSEWLSLKFEISTYWYGFTIVNYNNQQPFLKKLYHEVFTEQDKLTITDLLMNQMIDRMERFVNDLEKE